MQAYFRGRERWIILHSPVTAAILGEEARSRANKEIFLFHYHSKLSPHLEMLVITNRTFFSFKVQTEFPFIEGEY